MISIVMPVETHIRTTLRVDVYERLDSFNPRDPVSRDAQHVRLIGSFNLYDWRTEKHLTLEQVINQVYELVDKQKK